MLLGQRLSTKVKCIHCQVKAGFPPSKHRAASHTMVGGKWVARVRVEEAQVFTHQVHKSARFWKTNL